MIDPIVLEVLRCKLEAIAGDGARTIVRNAISPVVAEGKDCSCTIYSADGELVVGGGKVQLQYHVGGNGVRAIRRVHGDTIAKGDAFLVNDPYNGGGLHAQDVLIHIPIFDGTRLVAWVGASAHMADMGGMVPGSFSTSATEVYQEAFRLPPVRISRQGVEQEDIWAILRTNVRMVNIVEMDMRSLIAGANVVLDQVTSLVRDYGAETFSAATQELARLTEVEVRRRIGELERGTYVAKSWTEWTDELYEVPCTLIVEGEKLVFDFRGASPQCKHYFNSKPYIIQGALGVALAPYLAEGLPFNEGLFRTFEVLCDPGSILDAQSPAPIGGPHLDIGQNAVEVGVRALNLAIAASPRARARKYLAGPSASSGLALHTLSGIGMKGERQGWLMLDGSNVGASAAHDRDGVDLSRELVGNGQMTDMVDIEVMEAWYPIRFEGRRVVGGSGGAGQFCAGRGNSIAYSVNGARGLSLTIMGNRERVPIAGTGGGLPGAVTRFALQRAGAKDQEPLACHQEGVWLDEGDTVFLQVSNGGGWGDPLDRDPERVATDVRRGLLTAEEARDVFGTVPGNKEATERTRSAILEARRGRATPAPDPLTWTHELSNASEGVRGPLAVGVEQRGSVAVSERSGAPLAISPGSWTDGCPRIHNFSPSSKDVDIVAYLDPGTGHLLAVDVVPVGNRRSFDTSPARWLAAGTPALHAD